MEISMASSVLEVPFRVMKKSYTGKSELAGSAMQRTDVKRFSRSRKCAKCEKTKETQECREKECPGWFFNVLSNSLSPQTDFIQLLS